MQTNNKLREALDKIGNISAFVAENCGNSDTAKYMNDIISIVQEIIAEPARNCDVGTAEEQVKRFDQFCLCRKCNDCHLNNDAKFLECGVRWAQLQYEDGGAE